MVVGNGDEVGIVPEQARQLINALSRSGLTEDKKLELSEKARKIWEGWKVNRDDVEFIRKPNGERRRIGKGSSSDVYLAQMKLRDENDNVIPGQVMEAAVKQYIIRSSEAAAQFPRFMREIFLQKHAQHPCIVETLGGYWPDPEEPKNDDEIEPFVVMERMTCNLSRAQEEKLLHSLDSKRRVLRDVAEGIAHLHSRGIVHRDIKPENVLVNVAEGRIIGRAKLSDFAVSRKAYKTDIVTDTLQTSTGLAGTSPYRAPEAFSNSALQASRTTRDIWSFGVLMCEVLAPDFAKNVVDEYSGVMVESSSVGKLAEKIMETANLISSDDMLRDVAIQCLSLDPKSRPRIGDVLESIVNEGGSGLDVAKGGPVDGIKPKLSETPPNAQKLTNATPKVQESQDDFETSKPLEMIEATRSLSDEETDDVDGIPEQARKLLDMLSRSGVPKEKKVELAEMSRKVWQGWKIKREDISFVRKRNGDRKRIGKGGAADIYLARMKLRDANGEIMEGKQIDVAVKEFTVLRLAAKRQFPLFMREVFLQKHAHHPCIVQTHGGYWPDPDEIEIDEIGIEGQLEAWIVMERMTHNLEMIRGKSLMESIESKRRILRDVAEGISHLHSRGIVHRDIKPENVLVNVAEGRIIGRAKVCDFGVSRKVEATDLMAQNIDTFEFPQGSSVYMPPEAFSNSAKEANAPARDIWSFGVLMCEVLVPDFADRIVRSYSEGVNAIGGDGEFAKEVAESAQSISCDRRLGELAVSCLSLDPKMRPLIQVVVGTLALRMPLCDELQQLQR